MRPNERPVWPIFAWISGGLFAATCWTTYLSVFIDDRWETFSVFGLFLTVFAATATLCCGLLYTTYEKRPRGWRKLRRDAEREQYIKDLEREVYER